MELKSLLMCDASEGDAHKEAVMDFVMSWTLRRTASTFKNEKPLLYTACRRILFHLLNMEEHNPAEIEQVAVKKGWKQNDVTAEIILRYPNGQKEHHALLVENKVWTSTHDNQLQRYKQTFMKAYADSEYASHIHCVVITCFAEPPADMIADCQANGFRCIPIEDLQPVAPEEDTECDILIEFWLRNW